MSDLTPLRAIRKHCLDCVGGAPEVRVCLGDKLHDGPCPFFAYRMGRGRPKLRTIRQFCLLCMGGSQLLVRECQSKTCQFHTYRMGRSVKRHGLGGRIWAFKARKPEKGIPDKPGRVFGEKTRLSAHGG